MLGCTAVHTQRAIVARHDHRISSVPRLLGPEVQPCVSAMLDGRDTRRRRRAPTAHREVVVNSTSSALLAGMLQTYEEVMDWAGRLPDLSLLPHDKNQQPQVLAR
ncbi:uncharacterized protein APUU_71125S [Aspergillus puulaauensis]|uniref:Uncharacterized protein n=1 Tax=Aspergillus puulaauensis TaxID=1220207 RepID=A0A7R7XXI8_9EURO|nr:uncharacterized protein APUU_71125S [Aspergillus puulaauensis]BCS29555.1 hypothetical protein APUU_71125S [Aspergillus puulaauensis]